MYSIILSRRDFREFDQIISLYTKEKGKLEVLARGVKKITSKNAAHLEPFSYVEAEIISGKELSHLGAVQPINYFVNIRADLQKSLAAGYVVSLLDKVLHEGERDERLFNLTLSWLEFVNQSKSISFQSKSMLDGFIVKLLSCLGFDIVEAENLSLELKKDLEILRNSDWNLINNLKFEGLEAKRLHDFIYNFLVHHLERKVVDWYADSFA